MKINRNGDKLLFSNTYKRCTQEYIVLETIIASQTFSLVYKNVEDKLICKKTESDPGGKKKKIKGIYLTENQYNVGVECVNRMKKQLQIEIIQKISFKETGPKNI